MKRAIGVIILSTVTLSLIGHVAGIRPNISNSAPVGLWLDRPLSAPLQRGMMISVCPPVVPLVKQLAANGTLTYGICPETKVAVLLKPIQALPGDTVLISQGNPASVNGVPLPNTVASETLPAWPDGEYKVSPGEIWVFSSHNKNSFDSRYFGPVSRSAIRGEAYPLGTL